MHHLSKNRIFYLYDLDWQTGRGCMPAFTANPDTICPAAVSSISSDENGTVADD